MDLQKIKDFLDSEAGLEMKNYLIGEVLIMRDIANIKEMGTPAHQAVEIKAQKRAYEKLVEIMSRIMSWQNGNSAKDNEKDAFYAL